MTVHTVAALALKIWGHAPPPAIACDCTSSGVYGADSRIMKGSQIMGSGV